MGLSRKILFHGADHVNSCLHKSPPENDKLSRCHFMLPSHIYRGCPQDFSPLCTCRQVAFRKVRRNHSHTQTHTYINIYIYIFIFIHIHGNEMKSTLPHWNLIDRSMTARPPVLSPTSIFFPPFSHCALVFPSNGLTHSKFVIIIFFSKNCVLFL